MLCCTHISAEVAGAATTFPPPGCIIAGQPSTSHHLLADASREPAQGLLGFHRLHLQPYRRNAHGRIQPPCTTTWEYGHLINGLFVFLWLFSYLVWGDDIDIKCYDISAHLGIRKGLVHCITTSIFGLPASYDTTSPIPRGGQSYEGDE
jgi:hypothetical protein